MPSAAFYYSFATFLVSGVMPASSSFISLISQSEAGAVAAAGPTYS